MPNLMQILSIFLKLKAVKQSDPGFFGLLVVSLTAHLADKTFSCHAVSLTDRFADAGLQQNVGGCSKLLMNRNWPLD